MGRPSDDCSPLSSGRVAAAACEVSLIITPLPAICAGIAGGLLSERGVPPRLAWSPALVCALLFCFAIYVLLNSRLLIYEKAVSWHSWSGEVEIPFDDVRAEKNVRSTALSPDGRLVDVGTAEGGVRVCKVRTGQKVALFTYDQPVVSLAFSDCGETLAADGEYTAIRLWDVVATRRAVHIKHGYAAASKSITFADQGRQLVTWHGIPQNSWDVWSVATGQRLATFDLKLDFFSVIQAKCATVSMDGSRVAISGGDLRRGFCLIWNWRAGNRQWLPKGLETASSVPRVHENWTQAAAFAPNGSALATMSAGGEIKLWDVLETNDKERAILHQSGLGDDLQLAFSPDSAVLVAGNTQSIKLWEVESAEELATFHGRKGTIQQFAFSADGTLLATQHKNGSVVVWDVAWARQKSGFLAQVDTKRRQ